MTHSRITRLLQSAVILGTGIMLCAALANAQSVESNYKSKCAGCHGQDGNPSVAGKSLGARPFSSPEVAKESNAELEKIISDGKNKMPKYDQRLSAADIKGLVTYIRELAKKS
jgi:cytochrome c6